MGKTEIGKYLEKEHGFQHFDLEEPNNIHLYVNSNGNVSVLLKNINREKVVITWGFRPIDDIQYVLNLKSCGFKLVWFDGDRPSAFREFMKVKAAYEEAFYIQMINIIRSQVIDKIQPIVFNTFDENGNFKDKEAIAQELIKA